MATDSLIKKLLACLFVLSISGCMFKAYADEFYSPVQMQYDSWMASKSQFLTKIKDESGRYFAIYKDENDHKIEGAVLISHGDTLTLGQCKFQFQCYYQR